MNYPRAIATELIGHKLAGLPFHRAWALVFNPDEFEAWAKDGGGFWLPAERERFQAQFTKWMRNAYNGSCPEKKPTRLDGPTRRIGWS